MRRLWAQLRIPTDRKHSGGEARRCSFIPFVLQDSLSLPRLRDAAPKNRQRPEPLAPIQRATSLHASRAAIPKNRSPHPQVKSSHPSFPSQIYFAFLSDNAPMGLQFFLATTPFKSASARS